MRHQRYSSCLGYRTMMATTSSAATVKRSVTGDPRLLVSGWAGELAPDELDFLQAELIRDNKLAFQWGFRPRAKRRSEWAIRSVAKFGDPDDRKLNMGLARNHGAVES